MEPEDNYPVYNFLDSLKPHRIRIPIPVIQFFHANSMSRYPGQIQDLDIFELQMPTYIIRESTSTDLLFHGPDLITPFFLEGLVSADNYIRVWEIYHNSLNGYPNGKHLLDLTKGCPTDSIGLTKQFFQSEFGSTDPYLIPDIIQSRSIMDFSTLMSPQDLVQKLFDKAFDEFSLILRNELDKMINKGIAGLFPNGGYFMEPDFRLSCNTTWGNFNM